MISIAEHPIARLSNTPCKVCNRDTLHRGLKCLSCGTDFANAAPTVPYKHAIRSSKPKLPPVSTPVRHYGEGRREAAAELWMAGKLHCRHLLMGVTDRVQRMVHLRAEIIRQNLRTMTAGRHRGANETWEALWARIFREPL